MEIQSDVFIMLLSEAESWENGAKCKVSWDKVQQIVAQSFLYKTTDLYLCI